MNRLGKSKKLALGTTAALALAIPIVAGLAVQREALAQDNPAQPPARPTTGVRPEAPATAQRPASDRPRPTAPPAPAVPPQPPAPPASQADTAAPTTGDTATEAKDRLSPVHLEPPVYPPRALARGIEGWVILGFTVTAEGETRDVHAVQSSNPLFESAAIESVKKNTYVPRLVNGQAQEVDDVRVKVAFSLDRKAETQAPKAPGDPVSGDGAEDDGV